MGTEPFGQALTDPRALPSLELEGPQCHPVPVQQELGSYSRCRVTRTPHCWELGLQAISITVHESLLASNARWAVEQKISKKEVLLLAFLHSACGDREGQHCSSTQEHPSPYQGWCSILVE